MVMYFFEDYLSNYEMDYVDDLLAYGYYQNVGQYHFLEIDHLLLSLVMFWIYLWYLVFI